MYYAFDTVTGNSVSLKTRVKAEADKKVNAMNETERVPSISLGLARVYLNAADPKLATRTWQEVMENIVAKKKDETRRRWETAIKDRNFDCLRPLTGTAESSTPENSSKARWSPSREMSDSGLNAGVAGGGVGMMMGQDRRFRR